MGWHFPVISGETVSNVGKDKFWVLYTEPTCPQLREALMEGDRKARQQYGYVVGAARPTTPTEHQAYTFGKDKIQRFDYSGHRLVRPKLGPTSRSPSPRRGTRSPPRWMAESPP